MRRIRRSAFHPGLRSERKNEIRSDVSARVGSIVYALVMVAVIVGLDVAVFKHRFWERLIANVGLVLVFAAFYMRFLRRP